MTILQFNIAEIKKINPLVQEMELDIKFLTSSYVYFDTRLI